MAKVKVTLTRSTIGRNGNQKKTVQALGLSKLNQTKEMEATPQILGMLKKVKHLVTVEEL